jgi:AGCS family alanine or glycine:cation symporter
MFRAVHRNCRHALVTLLLSLVMLGGAASAIAQDSPAPSEPAATSEPAAPAAAPAAPAEPVAKSPAPPSLEQWVDGHFAWFNGWIARVLFFKIYLGWGEDAPVVPFAVGWLVFGAVFLTLRMAFINFRGFAHAVRVTMGRYDNKADAGEVSHFQALTTALSATVGLGNIAGVATAIALGGPGACFWMIVAGTLGMTSKFAECTLGLKYRQIRPDGRVMGGAMYYLTDGLKELKLGPLGFVLGYLFVLMCIGGSFAGGNSYQVNQSLSAISQTIPFLHDNRWVYGLVMTVLTGAVILGGLTVIARVAEKIVPLMCGMYILMSLYVLATNAALIPDAFRAILAGAFSPEAAYGGAIGVLVVGFQRASFSNEAGVGSAAIAHSAAKTPYPVREGIVALLEPFIDTVIVCTMTALVMVITNSYDRSNPELAPLIASKNGAALTSKAFGSQAAIFPYMLSMVVFLFAFSTQISWSYYGERCWAFLFGDHASMIYRIIFLVFTFLGSVVTATQMLDFGDLMILGMAVPNLLGVMLLSGKIKADLDDYWKRYKAGEFEADRTAKSGS